MTDAVTAEELVLSYGGQVALDRSTFSIPAGAVTAIIGPNGSGKSTLLNAIAGLMEPTAGTIAVPARLKGAGRIAYVLQTTKVNEALPITVGELVAMGRYAQTGAYGPLSRQDREAISNAMRRTGLNVVSGKHLNELSGGQRQRVFVAQGLAQDHDVLLLDEPLTAIDLPTAHALDEVIRDERARGCTVIITTHDLAEARVADHVLLLSGRVVASGAPEEVLTEANLEAAYGPALLHSDEGRIFLDDPAHLEVPGRHVHRERSIHAESSPTEVHGEHT